MNTSALLFILLGLWIFILQSKIKHLEKIVYGLRENNTDSLLEESQHTSIKEETVLENETLETDTQTVAVNTEEPVRNIETVKQDYQEPVSKEPSKLLSFITNYFTGGNLLVRIGGVILFFGLAFLVKYAAEHSVISMQTRLIAIAVAAIALVIVGWRLRDREGAYGQILQGLGVAMLYLVIYGAAKFYALLALDAAFVLMFAVVILGSVLAVVENALPLALFSMAGGFLVPILTSSSDGSHVVLFSYYVLLNFGLFTVSWYRSWRLLNIVGFLFTFVIATVWGVLRYQSELFGTTEPFLILFFLMYLAVSILFTLKHPFEPKNLVDGTLVFGLPLVAFPLQVSLVKVFEYGEAYSAVALGTLYGLLFWLLKNKERTGLLSQSFLALSVVFYTIAVPYIFDADVSAALWSLESAAIIWVSLKQHKIYARYFGEVLLFLSIAVYPDSVSAYGISWAEYMGYIIIIVASLLAAYLLDTHKKQLSALEMLVPKVLLGLSILLWFTGTVEQFMRVEILYGNALLFSLILGAVLLFVVSKWLNWNMLIQMLQGYLLLGVAFFFLDRLHTTHPFAGSGAVAWSIFVMLCYLFLYQFDKVWQYIKQIHILTLWFIVTVLMFEFRYHALEWEMGQSMIAIAVVTAPLVFSIFLILPEYYGSWLERYRKLYQLTGIGGLVLVLMLWELKAFSIAPDFTFLRYIPVFNPLDAVQIIGFVVIAYWLYRNSSAFAQKTKVLLIALLSFMLIFFMTVVFARAVHMFREVDYTFVSLWQDIYFQTGISILWSIIAIVLMLLSKHYKNRLLWLAGFGLLILVVLKLFFVELASSGTIERIISFIVVGSLLLLIGYFVPLPPSEEKKV